MRPPAEMDAEPDDRDELAADARDALAKLATGDRSTAVLDALEAWAVAYAAGECKAPTPCKVRLEMRNFYLRRAGYQIPASSPWDRAGELAGRVRTFELLRWESWRDFEAAPLQADAVDRALWQARALNDGDELPQSQGGLNRLF